MLVKRISKQTVKRYLVFSFKRLGSKTRCPTVFGGPSPLAGFAPNDVVTDAIGVVLYVRRKNDNVVRKGL